MSTLGERIREIRGKETQSDFSERYQVHKNTLLRWEKGERQPDMIFLQALIKDFGLSPEWLLMGTGPKESAYLHNGQRTVPVEPYVNLVDEHRDLRSKMDNLWQRYEAAMQENSRLLKENGDLRVEIENLKAQVASGR